MSKISPLRQLVNIISQSVDEIETALTKNNLKHPSLDEPFNPFSAEEAAIMAPEVRQPADLVVAACAQLSAIVHIPAMTLYDAVGGFHISSAMRAAMEANVAEILRGKSEGVHVNDIAAQTGADPARLARILRLLVTHHLFREVTPDVFANNRLSSMMDTLKSVEDIKADKVNKHTNTPGIAALLEHSADEMMKASAYMPEVLYDPVMRSSESPQHTPLALAFKTDKFAFDWFEEPGNEFRLKRFAAAMEGVARVDPPNAILSGFQWGSLRAKDLIVDVGGGLGHLILKIAKQHPNFRYIVQDRAPVIEEAKNFWETNLPSALKDGTVTLQVHDFFTPNPKADSDVAVFLCRMIIHDYPKHRAAEILKHLRAAAGPQTKLLLVEQVVPYASRGFTAQSKFSAKLHVEPQEPLLANTGKAKAIAYTGDMQMFVGLFGEERTMGAFEELLESVGWKVDDVFLIPGSIHSQILAIPI